MRFKVRTGGLHQRTNCASNCFVMFDIIEHSEMTFFWPCYMYIYKIQVENLTARLNWMRHIIASDKIILKQLELCFEIQQFLQDTECLTFVNFNKLDNFSTLHLYCCMAYHANVSLDQNDRKSKDNNFMT